MKKTTLWKREGGKWVIAAIHIQRRGRMFWPSQRRGTYDPHNKVAKAKAAWAERRRVRIEETIRRAA